MFKETITAQLVVRKTRCSAIMVPSARVGGLKNYSQDSTSSVSMF